ncbi:MAG: ABC transporter ATP-binding protein [Burkholderiales bacterium]|nr:ABC transporter ATP-binding protein [Burkholderiales bacterium]OJX08875.1 MAG: ABC transporter ATP-binding protein [Burkholderiales bacterium 70-64]
MLVLDAVDAGYDSSQVLSGMTLSVGAHEVVSLIGRNGMGKSTTVRTIMGLLPARRGRILLDGRDLAGLAPNRIARMGIGLVPEGRRIFGSLSVEENLLATARAPSTSASGWSIDRVHALFPRLRERRTQSARTLSGGEQQMLAIARALMTNPRLLVLDEATEGLAPLIRGEIWACLQMLKDEGQTILVIDKNLDEMAMLVDRHHIVEKGRVVWQGTPQELDARPEVAQRFLGV